MTIYVVGNCQATAICHYLSALHPTLNVEVRPWTVDAAAELASGDDLVFRQRNARVPWMLRDARPNEILFPRLMFNGFHPDLVRVRAANGLIESPLNYNHSSLTFLGWKQGHSAARTARLFCADVFERLNFFGYWQAARQALVDEGAAAEMPLAELFADWERSCFMYTVNHPKLNVIRDVARALTRRARLAPSVDRLDGEVADTFAGGPVWPVYPEIARRLGISGDYSFGVSSAGGVQVRITLDDFIVRSFEIYARYSRDELTCRRLESAPYRELEALIRRPAVAPHSPYAGLPRRRFWRSAIEETPMARVDPTTACPFPIDRTSRIATAGSCFAQHLSATLQRSGFNFYIAEAEPEDPVAGGSDELRNTAFSARYGNVYTARQLLQLFDRAYGAFLPQDRAWLRADGRFADPFRPRIRPDGYAHEGDVDAARAQHLRSVRAMFEGLDVFVFTLGLTETWRALADGAVFPLAPGVAAGRMDTAAYAFCNFTAAEVSADLQAFVRRLAAVNPRANVILTVSPVPLVATYEDRHVLSSTAYSKAALRVAADEVERLHSNVWYFPAYEIVTGGFNCGAYFEADRRSVSALGVAHVMRLFLSRCDAPASDGAEIDASLLAESRASMEALCDEEELVAGAGGPP